MEERLQKIIAMAGLASRRSAERMIQAGRVKVNGEVVTRLGAKADPDKDLIEVDDRPVGREEPLKYYIFNKPAGYITTLKDPQGRTTIAESLGSLGVRVFPVGRLDRDSEGLLILTNDGELARRLMHPGFHVPKVYRAKVKGHPSDAALKKLRNGTIVLGDRTVAPAEVAVIKKGEDRTWLRVTLFEGRNRQVRRMCGFVGHDVLKLKRTSYGPLRLGRLASGALRELTVEERRALKEAVGMPSGR